ncbi:MAG: signal peptidase II [Pseudomonadota bacterium]
MRQMYIIATVIFVLDQVTKVLVLNVIDLDQRLAVDILPPFVNLRMAWNTGINFGILSGGTEATRWILIAIALMITVWVAWWMTKEPRPMARVSAGFLIGGALGNVIDRLLYGAVADFLNMSCCGFENPYSFNVADISIFIGAIGLILFTGEKKPRDAG